MGTGSFPGVKSGQGMTLTPHPLLVPWSRKSRAIPLLPLWAIQPGQSLSACTRAHFTFLPQKVAYEHDIITTMDFKYRHILMVRLLIVWVQYVDQCFSTTGPWHQLYRAARGSP